MTEKIHVDNLVHIEMFASMNVRNKIEIPPAFLKWNNTLIGHIDSEGKVKFLENALNMPLGDLTIPKNLVWSMEEYKEFLLGRLPSQGRRDIEKILARCGMNEYNPFLLAIKTGAFSAMDLYWIATSEDEKIEDKLNYSFKSIFLYKVDNEGDSVNSPEGMNIKRYAVSKGHYGLMKKRLYPKSKDVEAEVAVYKLAKELIIDCCPAWLVEKEDGTYSFSQFLFNYGEEYLIHFRRIAPIADSTQSLLSQLIKEFKQFGTQLRDMVVLDFITRQDDRHLSNFALVRQGDYVSFYPLYDNGRSLFFENTEETMKMAIEDIENECCSFGNLGTHWDDIKDLSEWTTFSKRYNLEISEDKIYSILSESGFKGKHLEYSTKWIIGCINKLKELDSNKAIKDTYNQF